MSRMKVRSLKTDGAPGVAGFIGLSASERQPDWAVKRATMEDTACFRGSDGQPRRRSLAINGMGGLLRLLLQATLLHHVTARRAARLRLSQIELDFPDLPLAFDGYQLLHLSDLHLDVSPHAGIALRRILPGLAVDLMVVTGDLVEHPRHGNQAVAEEMRCLMDLVCPRDGMVATLGNHDSWRTAEALEAEGIRVLINETIAINRQDERLLITGIDDPGYFFDEASLAAMEESGEVGVKILLAHSPELAEIAAGAGYRLYLAGHTHGGQLRLPIFGAIANLLRKHRGYLQGLWSHDRMYGYTSAGVGTSLAPLRLNCPGEVVLITLRKSPT